MEAVLSSHGQMGLPRRRARRAWTGRRSRTTRPGATPARPAGPARAAPATRAALTLSSRAQGIATIFGTEAQFQFLCGGTASGDREWAPQDVPSERGGMHCHYNVNDGEYGNSRSAIVAHAGGNIGSNHGSNRGSDRSSFESGCSPWRW